MRLHVVQATSSKGVSDGRLDSTDEVGLTEDDTAMAIGRAVDDLFGSKDKFRLAIRAGAMQQLTLTQEDPSTQKQRQLFQTTRALIQQAHTLDANENDATDEDDLWRAPGWMVHVEESLAELQQQLQRAVGGALSAENGGGDAAACSAGRRAARVGSERVDARPPPRDRCDRQESRAAEAPSRSTQAPPGAGHVESPRGWSCSRRSLARWTRLSTPRSARARSRRARTIGRDVEGRASHEAVRRLEQMLRAQLTTSRAARSPAASAAATSSARRGAWYRATTPHSSRPTASHASSRCRTRRTRRRRT